MKIVLQRVKNAKVDIGQNEHASIDKGYLLLLGIVKEDTRHDVELLVDKIVNLRIMPDDEEKMNRSIIESDGEIIVVSQFTLAANLKGGRRPDFFPAMEPVKAEEMYEYFIACLAEKGIGVKSGQFAAHMDVTLVNDGPVTFILDSKNLQ